MRKIGLYINKFNFSWIFTESFYHSFFEQMSRIRYPNQNTQVDLLDFEKRENI